MSQTIGVDCIFDQDGRVRVRRVQIDDRWFPVEQGRQWTDEQGRHVLIIDSGGDAQEILLSSHSLQWHLVVKRTGPQIV